MSRVGPYDRPNAGREQSMAGKVERVLVTGAAGRLGQALREGLKGEYAVLRLTDVAEMADPGPGEEVVRCDLADRSADRLALRGDRRHRPSRRPRARGRLGPDPALATSSARSTSGRAARQHGVDRVVFASSNHAIGLYRRGERLDHRTPARPDSYYGLSKAFGEDLAALYAYKWGVRGFCMRIGTCFPEPMNERALHDLAVAATTSCGWSGPA